MLKLQCTISLQLRMQLMLLLTLCCLVYRCQELLDEVQVRAVNIANENNLTELPTLIFEFICTGKKYRFQHGSSICCCLVNLNIWLRLVFELQIFGTNAIHFSGDFKINKITLKLKKKVRGYGRRLYGFA
eukprot:XP_024458721.1 uncharacterized protein LOC7479496 [Populus trichocarpa]